MQKCDFTVTVRHGYSPVNFLNKEHIWMAASVESMFWSNLTLLLEFQ